MEHSGGKAGVVDVVIVSGVVLGLGVDEGVVGVGVPAASAKEKKYP